VGALTHNVGTSTRAYGPDTLQMRAFLVANESICRVLSIELRGSGTCVLEGDAAATTAHTEACHFWDRKSEFIVVHIFTLLRIGDPVATG